jgi:hypothetical protein
MINRGVVRFFEGKQRMWEQNCYDGILNADQTQFQETIYVYFLLHLNIQSLGAGGWLGGM